ncbi:tetratricopeptide repeat protein [Kaistia dalseonensis]|uniref:TPR repeat protein n=1 Tax=Kaistia dalseonensis TaxID=410840 RepID=A0ABU0H2W2_9HYPH|nr:tetratricopeptide repeat protein [Kaistia dalseonensis]MCX5493560.1 tetratricopeptide repeat protein [Kaistia dalseonensis]MDQ0436120.1 TPR repeat protein [Kaistia dalseonensis]
MPLVTERRRGGFVSALTWRAMRISNAFGSVAILGIGVIVGLCFGMGSASALDARSLDKNSTPVEAFRLGFNAYKQGDKTTAVEALTYAAEKGHTVAQWKLGRMYAEGDGLAKDDVKAFELFSEVADAHADDNPNAPAAPFVSNAFVALGSYYRSGIPNSDIQPDFGRARQMFSYAASYFGDSDAQLNLARMYYEGEGGDRDLKQAARWAKLSANKGNVGAQALLGHMLFEGDGVTRQPVVGLMFLTIARDRAKPLDPWIQDMQEQAFSVATETERRTALAMADEWMNKNAAPAP